MSSMTCSPRSRLSGSFPSELLELHERLRVQPETVRAELGPLVEEAMESARFHTQVLNVARDALEKFKLDLELTRFDLDATRRERETLRQILEDRLADSEN